MAFPAITPKARQRRQEAREAAAAAQAELQLEEKARDAEIDRALGRIFEEGDPALQLDLICQLIAKHGSLGSTDVAALCAGRTSIELGVYLELLSKPSSATQRHQILTSLFALPRRELAFAPIHKGNFDPLLMAKVHHAEDERLVEAIVTMHKSLESPEGRRAALENLQESVREISDEGYSYHRTYALRPSDTPIAHGLMRAHAERRRVECAQVGQLSETVDLFDAPPEQPDALLP
jgi:hypothetical protein